MGLKALASKLGNLSLSSWTQVKDKRERKKERKSTILGLLAERGAK